jgi:hypothetical protein
MKKLELTQGYSTIIDDVDMCLSSTKWYAQRDDLRVYAKGRIKGKDKRLHRVIAERMVGRPLSPFEEVDHANMDTLDNRRCNLRIASKSQNLANRLGRSSSGYKGVYRQSKTRMWRAEIRVNKKLISLGYFYDIKDAALAYNEAAIKYFGGFSNLNEIID